jgi:hypothetical protein
VLKLRLKGPLTPDACHEKVTYSLVVKSISASSAGAISAISGVSASFVQLPSTLAMNKWQVIINNVFIFLTLDL